MLMSLNYFHFVLFSSLEDLRRNKLRSFLTSLGITIGVFSVVLLIALGVGLKNYIAEQFEVLGKRSLIIAPGKVVGKGGFRAGFSAFTGRFDLRDVERLRLIPELSAVTPLDARSEKMVDEKGKEVDGDVMFVDGSFFEIMSFELEEGRFFTSQETKKRAKVVVLGSKLAKDFSSSPKFLIGKTIRIGNLRFKVIGILKAKGGFGSFDYDKYAYAPYTAGFSFNPQKKYIRIMAKVRTENLIPKAKEKIKKVLLRRYDEDEFSIFEPTEILSVVNSIFSVLNMMLVGIGAISLLVGGIGIMNIMYVSVVDRTREIGIRRAIGAQKKDVLFQFLTESVILSLLGGLIGLFLAFVVVLFISKFFPAQVNLLSVLAALFVSSFIGIFFGVFPAKKASELSPIEAIRYE